MAVRSVITMAAVLLGFVAFATPAAADIAIAQADTPAYTLTAGRLWSLVAAALGLIGVVTGGVGTNPRPRWDQESKEERVPGAVDRAGRLGHRRGCCGRSPTVGPAAAPESSEDTWPW